MSRSHPAPAAMRLYFEVQFVGRLIKQAKRRVMWKFAFEGDREEHSVVLMHTMNNGKKVRLRARSVRARSRRTWLDAARSTLLQRGTRDRAAGWPVCCDC